MLFQVPFIVSSVGVSQCSSRAVILSSDGRMFTCIVEMPHSMRVVGFPAGVSFPIKQVAISNEGRYLAAVDSRGRLFLEDVDEQKQMTRIAAVDQVLSLVVSEKIVVALDVTGHVWTCETNATRARRITEKTSVPNIKIAASPLHILTLGKTDRAIRRCSFLQPDTSFAPLLIPGSQGDVTIQPFPLNVSPGDDFIVTAGDTRAFWLIVKLERFHLKSLDLPLNFRFREVHVTVAGLFFVGHRGEIHRVDWEVMKERTLRVTSDMLIPFVVAPLPALLKRREEEENQPDVRPQKVAFGLVHALFLWVENDPDRTGELKAMMSEISAVLQETQELKMKIANAYPSVADIPVDRERLLRDALVHELEQEHSGVLKRKLLRELTAELNTVISAKENLLTEKSTLSRDLEFLKQDLPVLQQEIIGLRDQKAALTADVEKIQPVVADLKFKIAETGELQKKQRLKTDMAEIDSRLLVIASELKAKKIILKRLVEERDYVMKLFAQSINDSCFSFVLIYTGFYHQRRDLTLAVVVCRGPTVSVAARESAAVWTYRFTFGCLTIYVGKANTERKGRCYLQACLLIRFLTLIDSADWGRVYAGLLLGQGKGIFADNSASRSFLATAASLAFSASSRWSSSCSRRARTLRSTDTRVSSVISRLLNDRTSVGSSEVRSSRKLFISSLSREFSSFKSARAEERPAWDSRPPEAIDESEEIRLTDWRGSGEKLKSDFRLTGEGDRLACID